MGCGSSTKSKYEQDGNKDSGAAKEDKPAATTTAAATPKAAATTTAAAPTPDAAPGTKSDESEDEDDDEDEVEMDEEAAAEFEKQVASMSSSRKSRTAVSAESTQKSDDWTAPVYEKTEEQQARLRAALANSFMFAALEPDSLKQVIDAFKETPASEGQKVIEEGMMVKNDDPGLFVLEEGRLSVFKKGIESSVYTYSKPGQYFGDLAVLYNAPRAATVIADGECKLWSIDRSSFNHLVQDAARHATEQRMEFLNQVPLFNGLTPEEKTTISEALEPCILSKDDQVIKEGDVADDFYIVQSGCCEARKNSDPDKVIFTYKETNYFGELALLKEQPRAANVFAVEDNTKLLKLGAATFKRMLGSLEDLLKARQADYEGVIDVDQVIGGST